MKGKQVIKISNRRLQYKLELNRNVTIVKGNSGTGKTTLFNMVAEYTRLQEKSGVQISSDKKCVALTDSDWKHQLNGVHDSIVFIDEGAEYLNTTEFAGAVKNSNNYYVIFCREALHNLPYSVEEIYEMKTSGKLHTLKKLYAHEKNNSYYSKRKPSKEKMNFQLLLTEDAKSGLQFFKAHFADTDVTCETADGNGAIFKILKQKLWNNSAITVFVVADGAAFGAEMERVMQLQEKHPKQVAVCLPESFEWLILKSGLIKQDGLEEMLENPQVECADFLTWERFFTDYLEKISEGTHYQYGKGEINEFYTLKQNSTKIIALIARDNIR